MSHFLSQWIVKHPWLLIAISLIIVLVAATGAKNLWVTIDYKSYFGKDNERVLIQNALEADFMRDTNVIFLVSPRQGTIFDRGVVEAIYELTEDSWKMPLAMRVDSITNYWHSWAEDDTVVIEPLLDEPHNLSDEQFAKATDILRQEETAVDILFDQNAEMAVVRVNVELSENAIDEEPVVAAYAYDLLQKYKQRYPGIRFFVSGTVIGDHSFAEAVFRDAQFLTPLSYGLMVILLVFFLRSLSAMLLTLSVVTLSVVFAMGVYGWIDGMLNPIIAVSPYLILTIAVANSVHIFTSYFQGINSGLEQRHAMQESLRINFQPVFLTCLTTAIGFLCLNFSESPAFRSLGNVVAIGVMAAFFLAIFTLPSFIILLPSRVKKAPIRFSIAMTWLADGVIKWHRALLLISGTVAILLMAGFPKNELNDVFAHYFDETFQFRQANDFANARIPGFHRIDFKISAGEPDGISNPAYLKKLEEFAQWFENQQDVGKVTVVTDIIKRLNMNVHQDQPAYYKIPDSREEVAQYILMYEMSLPFGRDLGNIMSMDKSATKLTASIKQTSSEHILELTHAAERWLEENTPSPMHAKGSSIDVMFSYIARDNIHSMLYGLFVALVLISLILIFAFKDFKLGLMSLVPNILPVVATFGVWGYINGQIGLSAAAVGCLALGIVVDDTVHFLSKYLRARREKNMVAADAIRYAFNTVGAALLITSVIFVIGFGTLAFSHSLTTSQLGSLTAITITLAWLADFLLLPALLLLISKK